MLRNSIGHIRRRDDDGNISCTKLLGVCFLVAYSFFTGGLTARPALPSATSHSPGETLSETRKLSSDSISQTSDMRACTQLPIDFTSQYGEDRWINENWFKGIFGGIFLELGGYDGISGRNTLFLEKSMCWRGILIEGSPENFDKLVKNSMDTVNVGRAVCETAGVVSFIGGASPMAGVSEYMAELL